MFDEVDAYCSLYVDADIEPSALAEEIADVLGVNADGNYVDSSQGTIGVLENDELDAEAQKNEKNGFLYYRLLLEVEPKVEMGKANAVELVSKLLNHLQSRNLPTVTACHYEEDFPKEEKLVLAG